MPLVTKAEYARSRKSRGLPGGTKTGVAKAADDGRITLVNGKVDIDQADQQWAERTNRAQQRTQPERGADKQHDDSPDGETFNQAQTRKEIALANLRELEEAEKRKSLLPADDVRDAVNGMVMAARTKLLVIGDELADKLASVSDPVACRSIVDERIAQALSELAEYPSAA